MGDAKILVVDDEARMRKLVRDFLVKDGYMVVEAADGEEALNLFMQTKDISLIVMDVMMPRMDGYEACEEIRKMSQVPIILLFLWKNLGYNMILFMSGLANIPRDQIEVAKLEGATDFQIFWLIKIRYLSSTILFVTIMSLINSFKVFREVYLMGGDYPYDALYMLQHFMNNTFKSLDYQKLSAAAVMMAIFMILVIGALFLAENRFGKDLE